jgi:hypothetical protein
MKLQICTKDDAEALPASADWGVIVITDPAAPYLDLQPGWQVVRRQKVIDRMFPKEEAHDLALFVCMHSPALKGFLVCSNGGLALVQGVAAWLCERFNIPEFALDNPDAGFALEPEFNARVLELLRTTTK